MKAEKASKRETIERNFATVWPAQVAGFTRFLVHLRRVFDGDLDLMLVLAVIGDRTRKENWARELVDYESLTRGPAGAPNQSPTNLQSIVEASGIPRETVRRKLLVLPEKGWVTRDEAGHLTVSKQASTDLKDATVHAVDYLSTLAVALDRAEEMERS
ncbi:hypothetical protein HKCCE3408_13675 [Rhodobacterales bacterium HKCCE3408]|nr:hypothetical protein [Rhodobacterales bacterium HKCCE3408]